MPLYTPPHKIPAHRIACKALYRALLLQCPRIAIPYDIPRRGPVNLIKHLIRKQFKANINVMGTRSIVKGLEKGYAAENLLRSAGDGNTASLSQIHSLLRTINEEVEVARQRCAQPPPVSLVPSTPKPLVAPYPGAPKVLDIRPLPKEKLTGRRRVPILTNAGDLPFLRFKKPQSPYLSRVLRDKLAQKQKRVNALDRIEEEFEIGEAEEGWERQVRGRIEAELRKGRGNVNSGEEERERMRRWLELDGREVGGEKAWGSSEWSVEALKARSAVWASFNREKERVFEVGKKMLKIVEREEELWKEERRERKAAKKAKNEMTAGEDQIAGGEWNDGPAGTSGTEESEKLKAEMMDITQETEMDRKLVAMRYEKLKADMVPKIVSWKAEKVDIKPEFEEEMIEKKLMAKPNVQRKAKKVRSKPKTKKDIMERKSIGMPNAHSKGDSRPETEEEMMERKLMALEIAQRKMAVASKSTVATF